MRPLLALLALACAAPSLPQQDRSLGEARRAECIAKGGVPGRVGKAQSEVCHERTTDAGKRCSDWTDCQSGMCVIDLQKAPAAQLSGKERAYGQCTGRTHDVFGCNDVVIGGKIQSRCVD